MFVGQYNFTLDIKKRLVIPAKFRDSLTEESNLFVTLNNVEYQNISARYISIYPPAVWQKNLEWLGERAKETQEASWYFRKIAADTEMCKLDTQWRILVPERLIKSAELKREIMIVGNGDRMEVWEMEKWNMASAWMNKEAPQLEKYIYKPK